MTGQTDAARGASPAIDIAGLARRGNDDAALSLDRGRHLPGERALGRLRDRRHARESAWALN